MKKVFTENLPKGGRMVNKNSTNWSNSIGFKVKFIYNDIEGELEILDFNKKKRKVTIKYNDNIKDLTTSQITNGEIGGLLNLYVRDYRYDEGDIIDTITGKIEIINKIKMNHIGNKIKAYEYKCLKDNYIGKITEDSLRQGHGCPVCSNKKVLKGYNDIATTNDWMVKYFIDKNDAYKYTYGANKCIPMKCPNCGYEKNFNIGILYNQGFACPKCGDKVSYPEKIMFNLLEQIKANFEYQKKLSWSHERIYDFYILNLKCIIETHGIQHYIDRNDSSKFNKTLKEQKENDKFKKDLALQNDIQEENYIVIDCRYSDLRYIKNNIMNSNLPQLLNFKEENIDWLKCHEYACSSLVKTTSDLWNSGLKNSKELSLILKLAQRTIVEYLKKGKILNWNDYDPKEEQRKAGINASKINNKKVEIFKDGISLGIYSSIKKLINEYYNMYNIEFSQSKISLVCNKKRNQHKGYYFEFK